MLRAYIELVPHGMESRTSPIGHVTIRNNLTGTRDAGNYDVILSWCDPATGDLEERLVQVKGHPRRGGPWHLVLRALQGAIGEDLEGQ